MSGMKIDHMIFDEGAPLRLRDEDRERLNVLFLAKHALAGGAFDAAEGTHSIYHNEIKTCLEGLGIRVTAANNYEALYKPNQYNYIFTLLNRGGFRNSEILATCLSEYHSLPYMGAPASMRGFADDKHLTKMLYITLGIPTPQWQIYRTSTLQAPHPDFKAERYIIKPNNSSASWGMAHSTDWDELAPKVIALLRENHDVIVEEYIAGDDVAVPCVGAGQPWILYPMGSESEDDLNISTYEEKRGLSVHNKVSLYPGHDRYPELIGYTKQCNTMIWPYDYGRFDYRIDRSGKVWALEFNLSCNLGASRAISQAANMCGYSQQDLVESVLANGLERQRVMFDALCRGERIRYAV